MDYDLDVAEDAIGEQLSREVVRLGDRTPQLKPES
jgi:hypothetical protein